MYKGELIDELRDILEAMSDGEIIEIWNSHCENNRYDDDRIYMMYELDDCMYGMEPLEIIRAAAGIDPDHEYLKWDIWGPESTDDPMDWIDLDDIIADIVEGLEDFDNDDIAEIVEQIEEELAA